METTSSVVVNDTNSTANSGPIAIESTDDRTGNEIRDALSTVAGLTAENIDAQLNDLASILEGALFVDGEL